MINNWGNGWGRAVVAAGGMAALLAVAGCSSGSANALARAGAVAAPPVPGPAHTISTPARLGPYTRNRGLETSLDVSELREQVVKGSSGQASDVLSAVYAQGNVTPGVSGNLFMFVGGHLPNSDPALSIASFERAYPRAQVVSAGSLGGEAACADATTNSQSVAMCVWFDDDTFGTLVSPTMSTARLASILDTVRPGIEHASV
ncbi:MAG TPA: hypothetical protein VMU95_19010 [Trebonia sp.]|nr:hypothetical protein [Trebonia sp.]